MKPDGRFEKVADKAPAPGSEPEDHEIGVARHAVDTVLHAMDDPDAIPRPGQIEAVTALVERHETVLLVQATGWGKSLVYWAATIARRSAGAGPTVVISPLLALMRDQIQAAEEVGLRAATVNSANPGDWQEIFDQLRLDQVDVLLVSPERLTNPKFADQALPLLARAGLLVIDEAHCISDWGFDFRPDYQRVTRLLLHMQQGTPVLATTATANDRVTRDIATQLGDRTQTIRGPLARSSLWLSVVPGLSGIQRYAWVADALVSLPGSGIVYCLTVDEASTLTRFLAEVGHDVAAYTGATDIDDRQSIEDRLRHNQIKAVVATSALGMGYDKPDLAFCIHVGSPSSPVAYYQQVGRAGRQLEHAQGVLLPAGRADERIWEYFATAALPDPDLADKVLGALTAGPMSVADLERITGGRRGRVESLLKQLRVDGAVDREATKWAPTGKPWKYDAAKYDNLIRARRSEANLMRQYASAEHCLMQVLVDSLDDPHAEPCGRCSTCTGQIPAPGRQATTDQIRAASTFLRERARVVEPRKLWPRGAERKGRIVGCSPGRAVAFADDPGWPDLIAEVSGPDAPPSQELVDSLIAVLYDWRPEKPTTVVAMPDPVHPKRVRGAANRIALQFGLSAVELLTWTGLPIPDHLASGRHVADLEASLHLLPGVAIPGGTVLLIAESTRSRWSLTMAAARLREAGATAVLPLVVHLQP